LTATLQSHANAQVIILESASDHAFCAGEDLKETLAPKRDLQESFMSLLSTCRISLGSHPRAPQLS
jgi:crotonobetaine/carnitine-CoA ligase